MSATGVLLYAYDRELRPGVIGADFQADNPNQEYTKRYDSEDPEQLKQMLADIVEWMAKV